MGNFKGYKVSDYQKILCMMFGKFIEFKNSTSDIVKQHMADCLSYVSCTPSVSLLHTSKNLPSAICRLSSPSHSLFLSRFQSSCVGRSQISLAHLILNRCNIMQSIIYGNLLLLFWLYFIGLKSSS